jgi:hypothetical protein
MSLDAIPDFVDRYLMPWIIAGAIAVVLWIWYKASQDDYWG